MRLGTFADPHENSVRVFGSSLLAATQDDLQSLLGTVLRRDGHNTANRWQFG
jgi:hypothetical protein